MSPNTVEVPKVVSKKEWLAARKELLAREKSLTRQKDELSAERRNLPWEKVEQNYVFEGPNGTQTLADLFAGRSQLIVYHFMFGPGWKEGCPGCSFVSDHLDGVLTHLANRDVTLVAVSRAPYSEIEPFKKRMGWNFRWYSSNNDQFNFDYNVSFTPEEVAAKEVYYNYQVQNFPQSEGPGASVFFKDASGNIFHTYSTFGRGCESFLSTYNFLDLVPKGRDEEQTRPMGWLRHHDRYEQSYFDDANKNTATRAKSAGWCCAGEPS